MDTPTIAVAYGDGHAPGVMEATLTILREAGANIRIETIEIGSRIYAMDSKTGILPLAWPVLARAAILLMAPIALPEGEDIEDTGVVIREKMGLADCEPEEFTDPFTYEVTARMYKNEHFALFEPVYNEDTLLPRGKSDPSPMLHAAILMLHDIDQHEVACRIHNAWLAAREEKIGHKKGKRLEKLTQGVIDRLGQHPQTVPPAQYDAEPAIQNATHS